MEKKNDEAVEEVVPKRPVYSDSRRTNGNRGRVEIAVWENQTDNGVRFGTQLKFEYRPKNGDWKRLDNPLADQWLDVAKLLEDADSWKQHKLREQRAAKAKAEADADVEGEIEL